MKRKIDGVVGLILGLIALTVIIIIFITTKSPDNDNDLNNKGALSANIMNLEYPYLSGRVKLENGEFKDENSRITAKILTDKYIYGDIDGDGKEDAFLVFSVNTGGSGNYVHVASVLDRNSVNPIVSSAYIGDRIIVNDISIKDKLVVLEIKSHVQEDPLCCPSKDKAAYFGVVDGQIIEVVK